MNEVYNLESRMLKKLARLSFLEVGGSTVNRPKVCTKNKPKE